MPFIKTTRRIVLAHGENDWPSRPSLIPKQSLPDTRSNAWALILRRDERLLQENLCGHPSGLDPANVLACRGDNLRVIHIPWLGKARALLVLMPSHQLSREWLHGDKVQPQGHIKILRRRPPEFNSFADKEAIGSRHN